MPTRRDVIRFDAEPVKVKLDRGPHAGLECHGDYGLDWRYTVNNGTAVMYLPSEGREALLKSGTAAGEEVAIRKVAKGAGKQNGSRTSQLLHRSRSRYRTTKPISRDPDDR
jgi:hypothetical protein